MFFDELERIDRHKNSAMTLVKIRLRAYYEFRDRSEALQRVGHISGPRRVEIPVGKDRGDRSPEQRECGACRARRSVAQLARRIRVEWTWPLDAS